jgi:hypothetical protein
MMKGKFTELSHIAAGKKLSASATFHDGIVTLRDQRPGDQ